MKRIAFCFDGTWNKIDGENPTNVARIAQSISRLDSKGRPQIIYYDEGVGTSRTEKWSGGILGHGLTNKIVAAYHMLVLNYEPGDEIFVFGFSRGAFTARSFVGLLRNSGIMSRRSLQHIREAVELYQSRSADSNPNSEKARKFRFKHCPTLCVPGDLSWRKQAHPGAVGQGLVDLRVRYLGVWDTVGALGVPTHINPLTWINRRHQFHDTTLSSFVERARHAVSADERRKSFAPGIWTNLDDLNEPHGDKCPYEQLIFPGVHAGVGGGGPVRGLSDIALDWVFRGAKDQGLAFDLDAASPIFSLRPNPRAELFNATGKTRWTISDFLMGVGLADRKFPEFDRSRIHPSVVHRFGETAERLPEQKLYRPRSLKPLWDALAEMAQHAQASVKKAAGKLAASGDERALRAPDKIRKYTICAGDTLASIAEREMGMATDAQILEIHNRNVGLLFEDGMLYAGSTIEIPTYNMVPVPVGPPTESEQRT
jgi:uncharacterized protein (DUF2235 family)